MSQKPGADAHGTMLLRPVRPNRRMSVVHLQISNLPRSVDYFAGVLGMAVLGRSAGRAALGVAGAPPLVHPIEEADITPARRGRFGL